MPLPSPNLDDRTFDQLLADCRTRIAASCPEWTDLSPHDPGMTLLEVFTHLTEVMLYRFNRIPEKVYVELLRVIGLKLLPPFAATVDLTFNRAGDAGAALEIPRGTRVSLARSPAGAEAPVFTLAEPVAFNKGELSVQGTACHCEWIAAEPIGRSSGLPRQTFLVKHPPIVAPLRNALDLVVAVEVTREELKDRARAVTVGTRHYRVLREVEHFGEIADDPHVFIVDRAAGQIWFPPRSTARRRADASAVVLPEAGREVLAWYATGGGSSGNVAAGTLSVLKEGLPGVTVTNPAAAKGGLDLETLSEALTRGPMEIHSLDRVVTAQDFERLAMRQAGLISRAKAITHAALWRHGRPGTVEVLLVPALPRELREQTAPTEEVLRAQQTELARQTVASDLEERRPLGTACLVGWARYKAVRVKARVVLRRQEENSAVRRRVLRRLWETVSPLPGVPGAPKGREFGESLRASEVYDVILAEPGVAYADGVRLNVDAIPEGEVSAIAADMFQPQAWYVATGDRLFRTTNRTSSWERLTVFEGESVRLIRSHPSRPGHVVIVTTLTGGQSGCRVHVSTDCGETGWSLVASVAFTIDDVTWLFHRDRPSVLLAAESGLFELAVDQGPGTPVPVVVDPSNQELGFYAVAIAQRRSGVFVAVAARAGQGVYLSTDAGRTGTFSPFGLKGENIRVLECQQVGPRHFLWAGAAVPGFEAGKGCFRRELEVGDSGWSPYSNGWNAGSCLGLAFSKDYIFAATAESGVLRLPWGSAEASAQWEAPNVHCGLPAKELGKFVPVTALVSDAEAKLSLVGTASGLFSTGDAVTFTPAAQKEFVDQVTLPAGWLFCSGDHEITFVDEDEAQGD